MPLSSAGSSRRKRAVESFRSAAECVGKLEPLAALFAITRGQFSMIDAALAVLDQVGPAKVSVWTWTIAEYEVDSLERLQRDGRVVAGRLVIDHGARQKNAGILARWRSVFGPRSVRLVVNHAKIVTVEGADPRAVCATSEDALRMGAGPVFRPWRVLLRGSINLNHNPRFEQFDLTEGGADFDLVRRIENDLPCLSDDASGAEVYEASKVGDAFDASRLAFFGGIKPWRK
jgi:hypothetical protein